MRLGVPTTILECPISNLGKKGYPVVASSEIYALWAPSMRYMINWIESFGKYS